MSPGIFSDVGEYSLILGISVPLFCNIFMAILKTVARGRRGRRPMPQNDRLLQPPFRFHRDEAAAFATMTAKLRLALHPLTCMLPVPAPAELLDAKARLQEDGWTAKVAIVRGSSGERLLGDNALLWSWVDLGKTAFPPDQTEYIDEADALGWHCQYIIGAQEWSAGRKAAHAAVLAPAAKRQLPRLRSMSGLDDKAYTNVVLGELCKTSPREIGYARRLLVRKSSNRFRRLLLGKRGALRTRELERSSVRGSRARKCELRSIDPKDGGPFCPRDRAHVAIIDSQLVDYEMSGLNPINICYLLAPKGYFLFLCSSLDSKKKVLDSLNAAARDLQEGLFRVCCSVKIPLRVRKQRGQDAEVAFRHALIFSRVPKHHQHSRFRCLRKYDLRQNLDSRQCRVIAYERLLRSFCPPRRGRVFAPFFRDGGTRGNRIFFPCLKTAASRRGAYLITYRLGAASPRESRARPGGM